MWQRTDAISMGGSFSAQCADLHSVRALFKQVELSKHFASLIQQSPIPLWESAGGNVVSMLHTPNATLPYETSSVQAQSSSCKHGREPLPPRKKKPFRKKQINATKPATPDKGSPWVLPQTSPVTPGKWGKGLLGVWGGPYISPRDPGPLGGTVARSDMTSEAERSPHPIPPATHRRRSLNRG